MSIDVEFCFLIIAVLFGLDILLVSQLIINKLKYIQFQEDNKKQRTAFLQALTGIVADIKIKLLFNDYLKLKQSVHLDRLGQENIYQLVNPADYEKKQIKRIKSLFRLRRKEAAVHLGLIASDKARWALERAIMEEKKYPVKLYMANALADIAEPQSIPVLTASLLNSHRWYRNKVNMLISDFGESFDMYLPQIITSNRIEIKELIVDFASVYYAKGLRSYLIDLIDTAETVIEQFPLIYGNHEIKCCANCVHGSTVHSDRERSCIFKGKVSTDFKCRRYQILPASVNAGENYRRLVYKAAGILGDYYPRVLMDDKYWQSNDIELQNTAIAAGAKFPAEESIKKLALFLKNENNARTAVHAISEIIASNPEHINTVVALFNLEQDLVSRQRLAEILAGRIEYFIMKLGSKNRRTAADIIKEILLLNRSSEVIDFLNKNKDIDIENELAAIIKEVIPFSVALETELCMYLNKRLLNKFGLNRCELILADRNEKKDFQLIRLLYSMMIAAFAIFPIIYCIRHYDILFATPLMQQLRIFVLDFNYYLIFYSAAINLIYLGLLAMSYFNVKKQYRLWNIKNISLLFKSKILPSISIIAPAYNESKTIIESANSLLNLKYPDYELIIINDGSKDNTLDVLIKYFDLTRVDYVFDYRLNTRMVRGVYMNRSLPKLIVVDKENGGKADSLNAGINISSKEYFCGIDADSLLESDALLKLAALTLDEGIETPALGGNVFPINGCIVERGQIKDIKIPSNKLAKIQTIEYIRAFMAGRLGWAYLNSLLIISGAFGLFRKERVIGVGGYLTSSGRYGKDTVGEDMELVVRISRLMRDMKFKYRIRYAFNANCWTEVPEDLKVLKKQRYRWHRGLIDIITFHKKMLFNPAYGRTGMVAMPYFLIFEMIGPIIEMQGYLMVLVALFLGMLNAEIAWLLFITTIFMGVLVSISSLLIAEKDIKYFSIKDILILVFYAIIENFGPRQLLSLWRVGAYLSMLRKPAEWGEMKRKGFAGTNNGMEVAG